jgi:hypothetical protein
MTATRFVSHKSTKVRRKTHYLYAARAKAVVIRHKSNHQVIAVVEIASPRNKSNRHGVRSIVAKAVEILRAGIHLLIVDLFALGPRDPTTRQGLLIPPRTDRRPQPPAMSRELLALPRRRGLQWAQSLSLGV